MRVHLKDRERECVIRYQPHSSVGRALDLKTPGSVFTNHSQEHSLSLSPTFANWNVTRILIGYGLANQNLCYIQMPLTVEKSGE